MLRIRSIAAHDGVGFPFGARMRNSAPYVPRLALSGNCRSQEDDAVVDLTRVIGDADALRALVDDLFAPFQQLHVDLVAAVQVATTPCGLEVQPQRKISKQRDEASSANVAPVASGRNASVVAAAMAGAKQLGRCSGSTSPRYWLAF